MASQTSAFFNMPEEIVVMILDFLPHPDVITIATTCKSIAGIVYRNFVPTVTLPLSPQNLETLDGRYVLSLKSTFNIMALQKYRKGEYLENMKKIRLERLQKLVFVLSECNNECGIPLRHTLPSLYHCILRHYLIKATELTHLHIAIDKTDETYDLIGYIAKSFPCLKKVVLQAADTPDDIIFPIEGDEAQEIKYKPLDADNYGCSGFFMNLNCFLMKLLENSTIRSLEILGLYEAQNWECFYVSDELYPLEVYSKSLQHLRIEQNQFCHISSLCCPELIQLNYVDLRAKEFLESECFMHHIIFYGGYKSMLKFISECPKLERINNINIKSVRSHLKDHKSIDEWHTHLKSLCNCKLDQ
jgi:hypothetical protein